MFKFTPILLAVLYGLVMYHFSVWRTRRTLKEQSSSLKNPVLQDALIPLANALDIPKVDLQIYEIEPVNGLATADSGVFITRGFLRKFEEGAVTAAEMASVVAHELGHVALGHTRRRMIDFSGQNALRTTLALIIGRFIPGIGVWIANILTSLVAAGMSRADEFEADAYATALMIKAGYGADPQISMFKKLDGMTGVGGQMPAWFLSHPKADKRIAAIQANVEKWGA